MLASVSKPLSFKLHQIDTNLLPILDALLQERSVTLAANRVGRSQPAVSHALSRLRHLLENELLVRVGRKYELTAEAEAMAGPLHIALQQLGDVLTARPSFDPQSAEREFSVTTSDYLAATILCPAIQKLAAIAPGIRLSIVETTGPNVIDDIRNSQGRIAIYPVDERPVAPDLHFEFLTKDSWCCATWAGNPFVKEKITENEFKELPHIVEFFSPYPEDVFLGKFLYDKGYNRNCIVRTNYMLLIPFMLQNTSALSVLPRRMADWLCQAADLRVLELPFEVPDFAIEMCWSARYTADPAHRWLRSVLRDSAQHL